MLNSLNLVEVYNYSPLEFQLQTIKSHLIKLGGLLREYYRGRRILYADKTNLNFTQTFEPHHLTSQGKMKFGVS